MGTEHVVSMSPNWSLSLRGATSPAWGTAMDARWRSERAAVPRSPEWAWWDASTRYAVPRRPRAFADSAAADYLLLALKRTRATGATVGPMREAGEAESIESRMDKLESTVKGLRRFVLGFGLALVFLFLSLSLLGLAFSLSRR